MTDPHARIAQLEAALRNLINACYQGRMVPAPGRGVGGMSTDANIRGSVYNGVPAWPVEEAVEALASAPAHDTTAGAVQDDGRPCNTDVFLSVLLDRVDDHYDIQAALKEWLHGGWDEALAYIDDDHAAALRALAGETE